MATNYYLFLVAKNLYLTNNGNYHPLYICFFGFVLVASEWTEIEYEHTHIHIGIRSKAEESRDGTWTYNKINMFHQRTNN